jgi:hypothetical protein
MSEKIKIVIVGPEERKWPTEEKKERAKKIIESILHVAKDCKGLVGHEYRWTSSGFPSWFNVKPLPDKAADIEVISGHCPVGEKRFYCVDCNEWLQLGIDNITPSQKTVKYHNDCGHKVILVYDQGGVDTWVEMKAAQLGIAKDIHPAEVLKRSDTIIKDEYGQSRMKGYRARNIEMATIGYVGYCIVPFVDGERCIHHDNPQFNHPQNGGCFTTKEMNKLGKETHLVVIE